MLASAVDLFDGDLLKSSKILTHLNYLSHSLAAGWKMPYFDSRQLQHMQYLFMAETHYIKSIAVFYNLIYLSIISIIYTPKRRNFFLCNYICK